MLKKIIMKWYEWLFIDENVAVCDTDKLKKFKFRELMWHFSGWRPEKGQQNCFVQAFKRLL